jgi:lantibiotic modifying enzyme
LLFDSETSSNLDSDDIFQLYETSLASYNPLASLNSSNCGLEDLAGFYYGLKIVSNLDVHHIQPCSTPLVDSLNHFHSHLATNTLKSDLFSGVSGLLTASLSCSSELNDTHLFKLLDLLLSFQTSDGFFLDQQDSSKNLPLGIAHGIHGVLISLLHFYAIRPSHDLANSIHRLISAYNLINLDLDSSFNRNVSWCSGLSGHLIVLSYLSQVFPEYCFDGERIISKLMSSCHLDDKSDLYFCCGLSGVYASLLYTSLHHNNSLAPSFSSWFSGLKAHILNSFSTRLSNSSYELMKPSLLDGFSIFPLLESNSSHHLTVLESILLFKSW